MQQSQTENTDTGPVVLPLSVGMSDETAATLHALGRTEDIRFSPDNKHVAIVGFLKNRLALFAVKTDNSGAVPEIQLGAGLEIVSSHLQYPHGVDFVNAHTLVVANRNGGVAIFRLPEHFARLDPGTSLDLDPVRVIRRGNLRRRMRMPGSVCVVESKGGRSELLVCDNHKNFVSRHLVNTDRRFALARNQLLLKSGLQIPDGITMSRDKRWLAVSNHVTHQVFIYDCKNRLTPESRPDGICEGVEYPHGIRFSPDGKSLYVADAGGPCVYRFIASDCDWTGTRNADAIARIMDEPTFLKGRSNPQEGGPKGLDVTSDGRLLAVTSEHQTFGLFSLPELFS